MENKTLPLEVIVDGEPFEDLKSSEFVLGATAGLTDQGQVQSQNDGDVVNISVGKTETPFGQSSALIHVNGQKRLKVLITGTIERIDGYKSTSYMNVKLSEESSFLLQSLQKIFATNPNCRINDIPCKKMRPLVTKDNILSVMFDPQQTRRNWGETTKDGDNEVRAGELYKKGQLLKAVVNLHRVRIQDEIAAISVYLSEGQVLGYSDDRRFSKRKR